MAVISEVFIQHNNVITYHYIELCVLLLDESHQVSTQIIYVATP